MEQTSDTPVKTSPTLADWIFILFVLGALYVVADLGHDAYLEGMKTEITKKNGEEFAAWLTEAGTNRFKPDFEHKACMGGKPPAPAKAEATPPAAGGAAPAAANALAEDSQPVVATTEAADPETAAEPVPGTWGACFNYLMTQTSFKDMINPFTEETPQFVAACVPTDTSLPGMFVIEKLVPTPPGSAVPIINSQLVETDPIDQKMQVRVSVCDKGSYAIKIAEFEF